MGKAKPILFSGPMVRAILEGRKTQTRRAVKPVRGFERHNTCRPDMAADPWAVWWHGDQTDRVGCLQEAPHGKPGDILWVRESHAITSTDAGTVNVAYAERSGKPLGVTDGGCNVIYVPPEVQRWAQDHISDRWRPSIFMPRWASRITLEVTEVRCQRLNEISEEDAKAEGALAADLATGRECLDPKMGSYRLHFQNIWESINGKTHPWQSNPWVWAYTFKQVANG